MSNEAPVSDMKKKLEKELESHQQDMEKYKKHIKWQESESINILSSEISNKEKELKDCWRIQVFEKSKICKEIERRRKRIGELESLKDQEEKIENLVEQLKDITPGEVLAGYPGNLDSEIVANYTSKFEKLSNSLTLDVPMLNIIMIGETGAGKSSFLNTFATGLSGSDEIKDIYRTSPGQGREKSATQRIHLEYLTIGENGPILPCRFYDLPGNDQVMTIKKEHLMKIINGELKIDVENTSTQGSVSNATLKRATSLRKITLTACLVSGDPSMTKDWQDLIVTSSLLPYVPPQTNNTNVAGKYGYFGVLNGKPIPFSL